MSYRRVSMLPWIFAGLGALGVLTSVQAEPSAHTDSFSDDRHELIVLLASEPGVPTPEEVVGRARSGLSLPLDLSIGGPTQVRFVIPPRDRHKDSGQFDRDPDAPGAFLERYLVLSYPSIVKVSAIQSVLERNPQILYVGENHRIFLSVTPSDPLFPSPIDPPNEQQWGSYLLHLPDAWDRTKGHGWVGVIDLGIEVNHPDLRAFHTSGTSTLYYDGGNFRPQLSYDYGYDDTNVDEGQPQVEGGELRTVGRAGHGTHVAGIVGATSNNGTGVAGSCWNCSLIISKISHLRWYSTYQAWFNVGVDEADWVAGIYGAVDRGAQALNMSLGKRPSENPPDCSIQPTAPLCMALQHAQDRDVVIVAAAGNDGSSQIDFPAKDPRVLAAGGLAPGGAFWNECATTSVECGSNYDPNQLNTPAKQVLSTFYEGLPYWPEGGCDASALPLPGYPGYGPCTGTSMASPYLAGSSGLLRSINPLLSKDDIKNILLSSLENPPGWDPQYGKGKPNIAAAADKALGKVANAVLLNRLTPLFSLYSPPAEDRFYTTVPQMGAAAEWADIYYTDVDPDGVPVPDVPGYGYFPGAGCQVGPCFPEPRASVYIFTTDRSPNGRPLVPLYRMTFQGTFPGGPSNPNNRDSTYTTETAGILAFKNVGYELDGIEGYIYQRCTPEPSCIPAGAVRLYRMYNSARDDYAIFPESEVAQMQAAGYTAPPGLNLWIGYVYPNVDSDSDNAIDGFEELIGTNPLQADTDCDGQSDGAEILAYGSNGYGDPLQGSCIALNRLIFDSFSSTGSLNGRTSEVGGVTWTAQPAAMFSGGRIVDGAAVGGVPFNPSTLPGTPKVAVSGDIDPALSAWVGLGFADQATAAYWSAGKLWALLTSSGTFTVFAAGSQVASGVIPGAPVNGFHHVKIEYTPSTRLAAVTINGVSVYSQTLSTSLSILYAGFHFYRTPEGGGKLDNFQVSVQDSTVISDSFSGSGAVNGRAAEAGGVTWAAQPGAVVSGGRVLDGAAIAGVPFNPGLLPGSPTVAVTADVDPASSDWVGIGFANQATGPYWSTGQIWALVRGTGGFTVFALGTSVSGNIPGSPVNGLHRIKIQYSTPNRQATIWINGAQVFSQALATAPDIRYAGFHMYVAAEGGGKVDNFEVSSTTKP